MNVGDVMCVREMLDEYMRETLHEKLNMQREGLNVCFPVYVNIYLTSAPMA